MDTGAADAAYKCWNAISESFFGLRKIKCLYLNYIRLVKKNSSWSMEYFLNNKWYNVNVAWYLKLTIKISKLQKFGRFIYFLLPLNLKFARAFMNLWECCPEFDFRIIIIRITRRFFRLYTRYFVGEFAKLLY